jgi:glutamate carboxypeptidase
MDSVLAYTASKQEEIIALLRELVECESPSDAPRAIEAFTALFESRIRNMATVRRIPGGSHGPHLECEFDLPGAKKTGRILALGHSDTVYPLGTLKTMPWRNDGKKLWGPGVLDMKGGLAFFVYAMKAIRELKIPVARRVTLQINSDEEIGSESSRGLSEKNARSSVAVLVLEPGTGPDGKLKTARKGVGGYTVTVRGKAAHAGVDPRAGASAIVELARQIPKIAGFANLERGISVNPGVIRGGSRTNVVADFAEVEVDIRVPKMRDAAPLEKKFRGLRPVDKRCSIAVQGGLNRPPMERTAETARLFRVAKKLAAELGIALEESSTGGGSDGNFTAAVGAPTLDGLGTVGEGAHAPHESILIDRIADRTALIAKLVAGL